jgi:putative molybdopterin biosynthesis protein
MNKLYTAQEVADKLKIKKTTVYELIKRGELYSSKVGKQLRISEEQLASYLEKSGASTDTRPRLPDFQPESSLLKRDFLLHSSGLILSGQSTAALELLLSQMSIHPDGLPMLQSHLNSYNGLYSLYFQKIHVACVSIPLEDVRALVPGIPLTAIHLYKYPVGFCVRKGNPKGFTGLMDLTRLDIILANRERGCSHRILLDRKLKEAGISPARITGYSTELVSDLYAAAAVASGKADTAFGEALVAIQNPELEFHPCETLSMYLIMETSSLEKPGFPALLDIVRSSEYRTILKNQTGYDVRHTGEMTVL